MPQLTSWEWGLKIFDGVPTLSTRVDHIYNYEWPRTRVGYPNKKCEE